MNATLGKVLYGFLFCVALPAGLIAWAWLLGGRLPSLPPVTAGAGGWWLIVFGGGLMAGGMWNLWARGGGLPMSPFPPPRLVASGLYGWLSHPIYVGFALTMPGIFLAMGLPAGVWIVSPVIWLGTIALVVGHERLDLQRRFGRQAEPPRLALPPAAAASPGWWHRAAAYTLVLGPWLVAQEGVARLFDSPRGDALRLPFERSWGVLPGAGMAVAIIAVWIAGAPFAAASQAALRRFVRDGWVGAAILLWCYCVLPAAAAPCAPSNLLLEMSASVSGGGVPSAAVFWTFLAARLWTDRLNASPAYGTAAMLTAGSVATGGDSLAGVLAGLAVFAAVGRLDNLWRGLLRATEAVANSWRDWRFGGVRVINHGAYVALAAGAGLWLVGFFLGPRHTGSIMLVAACSLLGAGIWAQLLESSSGLSRPFGYYGGIFGGCVGVLAAQLWHGDGWLMLGAFAVVSPLVQGVGRLRCLVQGCCHGRPSPDYLGIRYRQPLSRVCKLARWQDVPVYPTPLYSILSNVVILGLAVRLWLAGAELGFITGACLILTACARFMEEGYRGEPQTARFGGLAIYQWLAVAFVVGGMVSTSVPTAAAPPVAGDWAQPLLYAVPFGALVWFAMGVDFPESNRRFSRLA
jgi:protein-S-isoprenylcysteine O-methyltransferase Ste14